MNLKIKTKTITKPTSYLSGKRHSNQSICLLLITLPNQVY